MKAEWTELMFMQIREGSTTGIVFALAVACVFLALAPLYESWTLPLAVILVGPLCVLCSILGVLVRKNFLGHDASVDIFVHFALFVPFLLPFTNHLPPLQFS